MPLSSPNAAASYSLRCALGEVGGPRPTKLPRALGGRPSEALAEAADLHELLVGDIRSTTRGDDELTLFSGR